MNNNRKRNSARGTRAALAITSIVAVLIIVSCAVALKQFGRRGDFDFGGTDATGSSDAVSTDAVTEPESTAPDSTEDVSVPDFPDVIYSKFAKLTNVTDDKVISSKDSSVRTYPASLTKIMTAIVAIENITDMNKSVTLDAEMFAYLTEQNASVAGYKAGEVVTAKDLLYAAMLPSGADGSIGLAYAVSGSEAEFVKLMNKKAEELGMNDTHFENCTGLHSPNHYSTVDDMTKLFVYALKNPTFYEAVTSRRYYASETNLHPNGITFYSTVFSQLSSARLTCDSLLGGKTGYTPEAGLCLASLYAYGGKTYVLVTMGAGYGSNKPAYHIMDAVAIMESLQSGKIAA